MDDKIIARAKNNAFALLRIRPRSERELTSRLKNKGYSDDVVGGVLADLKKRGLIDDAKFARFWVDSRLHLNPVGDVILKHELKGKGVDSDIIEAALAQKESVYDEYEAAKKMAEERFRRFRGLDRRKATKRVYDFLLRRGFKYDTIRRIIEEIAAIAYDD